MEPQFSNHPVPFRADRSEKTLFSSAFRPISSSLSFIKWSSNVSLGYFSSTALGISTGRRRTLYE
ncbi:hypothetical protein ACTXT7_017067 [Hymenolepis weldensis]